MIKSNVTFQSELVLSSTYSKMTNLICRIKYCSSKTHSHFDSHWTGNICKNIAKINSQNIWFVYTYFPLLNCTLCKCLLSDSEGVSDQFEESVGIG